MSDPTAELMDDINHLFTLTAKDVDGGFDLAESICMNISCDDNYNEYARQQAQTFWCYVRDAALDAYLAYLESESS